MDGRRWRAQVAGLPCTVEREAAGDWVVTVAGTSVTRNENLAEAIVQAACGLAERHEAEALAAAIDA